MPKAEQRADGRPARSVHEIFPEALALFNPPLSAVAIAWAARECRREGGLELPFPFAFLILPMALHEPTRDSVLASPRLSFGTWAQRNQRLIDSFPRRAFVMIEPTRRSLRFGVRFDFLEISAGGVSAGARIPSLANASEEAQGSIKASQTIGKWLSRTNAVTAFSLLGIRE